MSIFSLVVVPILFLGIYIFLTSRRLTALRVDEKMKGIVSKRMKISGMLLVLIFAMSVGGLFLIQRMEKLNAFSDVEIWNGSVVSKNRVHGQYTEHYECNCRTKTRRVSYTVTNGSGKSKTTETRYRDEQYKECDTCDREWYTVKWSCETTLGHMVIDTAESTSTAVYQKQDPVAFINVVVGDPASRTRTYTNYLQGSDQSVLHERQRAIPPSFNIPAYPTAIYSLYKLDRFFTDIAMPDGDKILWNKRVAELNRDVGAKKQANIIVYVTQHPQEITKFIEAKWDGLNKNDIVLVIGASDQMEIKWAKVLSWTKREDFKINVRDRVMALPALDLDSISSILADEVMMKFERRQMKDFQYLEDEIQVSWELIIGWFIFSSLLFVCSFVFVQPKFWENI